MSTHEQNNQSFITRKDNETINNLFDTLHKKRFGTSQSQSQSQQISYCCECGDFCHIACVFEATKLYKANILSIGINKYDIKAKNNKHKTTIHAEYDAISKLPFLRKQKKISILVIRLTKHKKLAMSKPCLNCITNMFILFPKKGYIIHNIYYSNNEGTIIKTTLTKLATENNIYK